MQRSSSKLQSSQPWFSTKKGNYSQTNLSTSLSFKSRWPVHRDLSRGKKGFTLDSIGSVCWWLLSWSHQWLTLPSLSQHSSSPSVCWNTWSQTCWIWWWKAWRGLRAWCFAVRNGCRWGVKHFTWMSRSFQSRERRSMRVYSNLQLQLHLCLCQSTLQPSPNEKRSCPHQRLGLSNGPKQMMDGYWLLPSWSKALPKWGNRSCYKNGNA